jgi:aspartate-semialdehyde dehydrogenase
MSRSVTIAVINTSDMVAEVLLERMSDFVGGWNAQVILFDSAAEEGDSAIFNSRSALVQPLSGIDFSLLDLAFFCGDADDALLTSAAAQDCRVIDLRRTATSGSVVVAGINDRQLAEQKHLRSPHPVVACLAPVLNALSELQAFAGFTVTAMLPASEAGNAGTTALAAQTARLLNGQPVANDVFGTQLAFNVIAPSLGDVISVQQQICADIKTVCGRDDIVGNVLAVTVSVFYGMSLVVDVVFAQPLAAADVAKALRQLADTTVASGKKRLPSVDSIAGETQMHISVLPGASGGTSASASTSVSGYAVRLWIVADNIHRGRVYNALAVADSLLSRRAG